MIKNFVITGVFLTSFFSGFCQEGGYYPVAPDTGKNMKYWDRQIRRYFNGPVEKDGKTYIKDNIKYSRTVSDTLIRVSRDTVYVYSESLNREMPYFGIKPELNQKIGYGTITNINAVLKTPKRKYKELLEVTMNIPPNEQYKKGTSYIMYFQKNVGLIAIKQNDYISEYLLD